MSTPRPADTVARLSNYLWWLLPSCLKKKDKADSLLWSFCDVWGEVLDDVRTTIEEIIPLFLADAATGEWLDRLARARLLVRGEGESDESLSARCLAAYAAKKKGGTIAGLVEGLASLGYGVTVTEPYKGTDRWSRFLISIATWDGALTDQWEFYRTVRALKPGHTKPHYVSSLDPCTWDDWTHGETELELDSGSLDDWLPTT